MDLRDFSAAGRRRVGIRRVVVVVPSAFTLANLFFGFWAIVSAFNGNGHDSDTPPFHFTFTRSVMSHVPWSIALVRFFERVRIHGDRGVKFVFIRGDSREVLLYQLMRRDASRFQRRLHVADR